MNMMRSKRTKWRFGASGQMVVVVVVAVETSITIIIIIIIIRPPQQWEGSGGENRQFAEQKTPLYGFSLSLVFSLLPLSSLSVDLCFFIGCRDNLAEIYSPISSRLNARTINEQTQLSEKEREKEWSAIDGITTPLDAFNTFIFLTKI